MVVPPELIARAASWAELKRWERRELGQELRGLGLSYREIAEIIPVSKGTLSGWCRDHQLTPDQEARLRAIRPSQAVRRAVGAQRRRANLARIEAIKTAARQEALRLMNDPFWVAGAVGYWAEGAKREKLMFANSDPDLVFLFVNWASRYLAVTHDQFTISLHLHTGQSEGERMEFWSQVTGFPRAQFRKSFVKPEGTGHRKNRLYNGTAQIRVARSGELLHRVMGWIDAIAMAGPTFAKLPGRGR